MAPTIDWDVVRFNPVEVQLIMDGVTEDNEEFPGNFILYNKDDDDDDGVPDYDDGFNKDTEDGNDDDENTAEDDLVKITIQVVQPSLYMSGPLTFDVTSGASKVKVWEPNEYYPAVPQVKYKEITLPVTYNTPTDPNLPKQFYVEGIDESGGPGDVEFTLTYTKEGLTFEDKVKVTVVHVELFKDAGYTELLDDWPKLPNEDDILRSPKYLFGEDDPIYVQVKNIGKDPDEAEYNVVAVTNGSSLIYVDLKETGPDTQIFRNSESEIGELLYLSTEDDDDDFFLLIFTPEDKIKVTNEEVLYFWLRLPPVYGMYKRSEDVMVDRAEIGVEWQKDYDVYCSHLGSIDTDRFGEQLYNNIGGEPGLVWFKNFDCNNLDSHPTHWKPPYDSAYTDSVDMTSWSGHAWYDPKLHFFTDSSCVWLYRQEIKLGDLDAEWIIFDTCWFLDGTPENLKADLLSSNPNARSAHMFLGFGKQPVPVMTYWHDPNCGKFFTGRLKSTTIQQAWFDYCDETQYKGCKASVFRPIGPPVDYSTESLAGSSPIEVLRDPIASDNWSIKAHINTTGPDPPPP